MLRRTHIAILSVLCLGATSSEGQTLNTEQPSARRAAILHALANPAVFDFDETPLNEVVAAVGRMHDVDIYLDLKSLDEVGIGSDTPLTCRVRRVSLASALDLLLSRVDPTLAWTIFDDRLTITTREAEEDRLTTVIYDVWSLTADEDFDSLVELIMTSIEPHRWDPVGGPGSISPYRTAGIRTLVVSQTLSVHRKVEALLVKLHQLGGHPLRAAPALRYGEPRFSRERPFRSPARHVRFRCHAPRPCNVISIDKNGDRCDH